MHQILKGFTLTCLAASQYFVLHLCAAMAHAQAPVDPSAPPSLSTAVQIYDAIVGHQWTLVAALVLMVLVYVIRQYTNQIESWGRFAKYPDVVAMSITVFLSVASACTVALFAGHLPTWPLVSAALSAGFLAAGGFAVAKSALLELWPAAHAVMFKLPPTGNV